MNLQLVFGNPRKGDKKMAKKKAAKKSSKKTTKRVAKKATKKATSKRVAKKATKKKVVKKATAKKATKKVTAKRRVTKKKSPPRLTHHFHLGQEAEARERKRKSPTKSMRRKKAVKRVKSTLAKEIMGDLKALKRLDSGKVVSKKATKKRATKRKVSSKRKASKKKSAKVGIPASVINRKTRSNLIAKMKKGETKVFGWASRGGNSGKGKGLKEKRLAGKGSRYSTVNAVTRHNPIFGGNAMKKFKDVMKHEMAEAGGLLLGGFASEGLNTLVLTKFPTLGSQLGKVFGKFAGAIAPLTVGVVGGLAAEKLVKNANAKKQLDMVAKGLIGSSVVSLGNAAYNALWPQASAPVGGLLVGDHRNYAPELDRGTDFGGFVTGGDNMGGFVMGDDNMGYSDYNADFGSVEESADFGYSDDYHDDAY